MRTRSKGRSCAGKRRYEGKRSANKAIRQLVAAKRVTAGSMHSYQCGFCDGWHIGHTRHGGRRPR